MSGNCRYYPAHPEALGAALVDAYRHRNYRVVATAFSTGCPAPGRPFDEISDIVDAILYLERASFVTGEILHVDGGQNAGHLMFDLPWLGSRSPPASELPRDANDKEAQTPR